jgi:hypothetical protein
MKYVVTTERTSLNVRTAPRLTAGIIRVLDRGEIVELSPQPSRTGWRELTTGGWVSMEFMTPADRRETVPLDRLPLNQLPAFQSMWDNYPPDEEPEPVKKRIGGKVNAGWIENTCTIRLSHAFNYSGHAIPNNHPSLHTVSGADGMFYAYRVREMRAYMEATFGGPKLHVAGPEAFLAVTNKRGVIMFDVRWRDATGHFDIWNGKQARHHAYFAEARKVLMWW